MLYLLIDFENEFDFLFSSMCTCVQISSAEEKFVFRKRG